MTDWHTDLASFVEWHEGKGSSKEYVRSASRYLERLGERFDKSYLELTARDLETWFAELRKSGIADTSLGSIFAHVRACMRFLNGGITPAVLSGFKARTKRQWKKRPRVASKSELLTDEDMDKLAEYLTFRWRTALWLLRYSGARPSEVLRLREQDVRFDRADGVEYVELHFPDTKTNVPRTSVVAKKEAVKMLRDYLRVEGTHGREHWLFYSEQRDGPVRHMTLWKALQRAKKKAGIQKSVYAYLARHTRATEVHDLPPAIRDKAMGWESGLMWKNYTHLVTEDVRDALLELEGSAVPELPEGVDIEDIIDERIAEERKKLEKRFRRLEFLMEEAQTSPTAKEFLRREKKGEKTGELVEDEEEAVE